MKLIIEINLDNDATSDPIAGDHEIARILNEAGNRILRNGYQARFINGLMDCNGNSVGTMRVEED